MDAGLKRKRGIRVAHVVEANARYAGLGDNPLEAIDHRVDVQGAACAIREDEWRIVPEVAEALTLEGLAVSVRL